MADSGRYVFRASRDAHTQITQLFDFIQPTAIAMWNLRWQVQGFLSNVPTSSTEDLAARFALGSGINAGSIKRATVDSTWDSQREQFANIVLVNSIAVFEDFTAGLAKLTGLNKNGQRDFAENLQFPNATNPKEKSRTKAILKMGGTAVDLANAFIYDPAVARRNVGSNIDYLLICYRYFKEVRNALAHNGGKANQRTVDSYNNFSSIASKLGTKEIPQISVVSSVGDNVNVSLRGAIGFTDVLLRIIATYDVEFSALKICEAELKQRFQPQIKGNYVQGDQVKKDKRLVSALKSYDFPTINPQSGLRNFLKREGLIPHFA